MGEEEEREVGSENESERGGRRKRRGVRRRRERSIREVYLKTRPLPLHRHTHTYLADMQATCNDASLKDIARKLHSLRHH